MINRLTRYRVTRIEDQRIESSNTISGRFLSKPRTDGPPSTVQPPYNPIQWAIMSPPENETVVETHEWLGLIHIVHIYYAYIYIIM